MQNATIYLWRGQALVFGGEMDTRLHAHHALQLTLALSGRFSVQQAGAWSAPLTFAGFVPDEVHGIDGRGAVLAYLFVDATVGRVGVLSAPGEALRAALACLADSPDPVRAAALAAEWRAQSLPAALPSGDRRVRKALDWLEAHAGEEPNHEQLAAVVALSPSRFAHLFKQHTGQTLSRFLLWRRLLVATTRLAAGERVTQAALAAGFADTAHLSRAFHATFGVTPSELLQATVFVGEDVAVPVY